uniref:2-acylglycerol O-acyltransferase 3 isoform X2 n=1 Tax=Callithrix jacchus TaxID=9483 RepID=UPI0023DCFAFB|nr:2-acylglycerol O-acyltransferase 3 isoform X2 [Callithrix jacchus]
MGVSTAPPPPTTSKTPRKQHLEAVGAYQYVLTFLFMGGRRSEWMRNQAIWRQLRDYYPVKLVKTAELPPDRNYVLGAHPHGVMCTGFLCNFSTESNGFSQLFPGLQPWLAVLAGLFYVPVYRDYIMSFGLRPVSRQSLDFILSQPRLGQAVVIMVGGAHEALYSVPGKHCLTLRKRKGFVRLALRHGASLVPVYSFGENDIFRLKAFATGSWQHWCQLTFKKLMGFSPCIFWGRSLFSATSWGLLPFAVPITTVGECLPPGGRLPAAAWASGTSCHPCLPLPAVGRPIPVPQRLHPTEEEVSHYHALYMMALEKLFEEHKESCGVPASTCLTLI